ncbi:hypothetical protein EOA64_00445 [Mesorhizobium sp. M1A.F.Ca.IN.022.02.1.1]|uniref:hypothetical protein n=1 Tax=Mesorhizobium sp. M1A.F.Ca.IN.022.02.1.1 TaxID=2496766 RepID=UPI000FCAC56A|nr:hypothetical protein [Mesorhizobium sp. M1A.F.Ca.IN.022.02.1.1]RUV65847.1 hypothetical protein EOA64_00445 [Mesorhizobium sp. M1A.F.Ca.IN.022.02.1.1]RWI33400.1 MAG: hypothetical protein EOR13_17755 [Mesorhizobium sp.]
MKIRFKIGDACFNAANAASGGKLNREEIEAAYQRMAEYKQTLQASGNIEGMADKLRSFAEKEAERTKIAAAMQRRHAALNILVRDRLDQTVTGFINAGMSPRKALLAVLEGTQRGIEGGRNSVGALNMAYEARYIGGLFGELQAKSPHLIHALRDPKLDADIMREMAELKEGGKPGITGNKDAQLVAKTFATYAEMSRTDLNKLGASIGKLDGWAGAQTHDNIKMIAAGKEAWISSILPKLDLARTFPDAGSAKDIEEALSGIYDTLVTGFPNKPTPKELGQRVNPANLAKSLGKSRVLHFKDAEAALAYRDEFGFGTTASGMVAHLRSAARVAANMEALGPNPEVMFGALVDGLKRSIKEDPKLSPAEKTKRMKGLTLDGGQLRHALDISTGMISRPVDVTAAKIGGDIRAVQSLAKLGAAIWSSMSDTVTAGIASQFRGSGFFRGFVAQIDGIMHGRPKGEQAEISYLLGEGFDGLIGHIVSPAAAVDGPVGRLSKMQETFFRWNGLSWWTDIQRASAGRMISAEMGMRAKTGFADLPANYRHVLGLHGIDAAKWEAIRKIEGREIGGRAYITPDMVRNLPDEAVAGLGKDADTARHDLEMALHRFVADETSYGVIETDARSRRTTTWGTRPGTLAGEGIRFIMQFKGFPIAFSQRTIGRGLFGFRQGAKLEQIAHIGTMIAGLTMAGYAAMTMKDLTKGYWPPRDPADIKTWEAAFIQGGAAGIYGDYLFGRVNRFGSGLAETAMGPALGAAFDLGDLILKARDASISEDEKVRLADWLNFATQNTPFVNLYYVRPALDFLFLNSLREVASPGYRQRTDSKRRSQYGQQSFMPKSLAPFN